MNMRWVPYFNLFLVAAITTVAALFFLRSPEKEAPIEFLPHIELSELPKSPFATLDDQALEEGALALNWVAPQMQLPDLREELRFYGENGRPDATHNQAFHVGLQSSGEYRSIREGERVYLLYKGNFTRPAATQNEPASGALFGEISSSERGTYTFSPHNQPTPLWIEPQLAHEGVLLVGIQMLDEKGLLVKTPDSFHQITLHERDLPKSDLGSWELGGLRVDSTLLVRQKARWVGSDRFLEVHGGDEFSYVSGLERIDFLAGETPYSCFIGPDQALIWKEERWVTPEHDESTYGYPLLCVRKVDEKILSLELWDTEGRSKTVLSLVRARDPNRMPNLAQEFKFVGAKTWAQFIVESRKDGRMTLKPNDWLILTQDGWKKLDSVEEIDAYVAGQLAGPLFILDKMTKQNGRQALVGHLFNSTRTEMEEVELEASSNTSLANYCRTIPVEPPIKAHIEGDDQ